MQKDNDLSGPLVMGTFFMRWIPVLHVLGITNKPDEVALQIENFAGHTQTVTIPADSKTISRRLWDGLPARMDKFLSADGCFATAFLKKYI